MEPEEMALLLGQLQAKMEQMGTDVSEMQGQVKDMTERQGWTRDDISNLFSELWEIKNKVEVLEEPPAEPEPPKEEPPKETELDSTTVQPTPKKNRRWGLFD